MLFFCIQHLLVMTALPSPTIKYNEINGTPPLDSAYAASWLQIRLAA